MTEATITIEDAPNSTAQKVIKIAHISGQLDESNVDEKVQTIYKALEEVPLGLNLVFELEKLDYMNSKSIGYLTDIYGKTTGTGGQVAIAGAKPNIIDILQVVGLTQLIKSFPTLQEALSHLASTSAASVLAEAATPAPVAPATTPEPAPTPVPTPETPAPVAPAPTAPAPAPVAPAPTAPVAPAPVAPAPVAPAPEGSDAGTFKLGA